MRFHRSLRVSHDDTELLQLERQKGKWFIGEDKRMQTVAGFSSRD